MIFFYNFLLSTRKKNFGVVFPSYKENFFSYEHTNFLNVDACAFHFILERLFEWPATYSSRVFRGDYDYIQVSRTRQLTFLEVGEDNSKFKQKIEKNSNPLIWSNKRLL